MKSNRVKGGKTSILVGVLLSCLHLIIGPESVYAQPPVPPPQKVWVSLGYSSIDDRAPDWKWLRTQCLSGRALKVLQPLQNKLDGLVVPIFDDGRCFYSTSVEPFKARNAEAQIDEQALRDLLSEARRVKVPVYLGLDLLAWQRTNIDSKTGVFGKLPDLQEINQEFGRSSRPEALYASPFNDKTRAILLALVKEVGNRFPEASGVVFDLHLSSREMLGFSEAARAASMMDIGIDPIDLSPAEPVAEDGMNQLRRYVQWRRNAVTNLLATLAAAYRAEKKDALVLASGLTDYYVRHALNDRRLVQDWRGWIERGIVDAVLLEGRWLPRYNTTNQFVEIANQITTSTQSKAKDAIIPATAGSSLVRDSSYQKDWGILKSRANNMDRVAAIAYENDDLKRVVMLASGQVTLPETPAPKVGEVAPHFTLSDYAGKQWDLRDIRTRRAPLLFLSRRIPAPLMETLTATAPELRRKNIEPLIICNEATTGAAASAVPILTDITQELNFLFDSVPKLILVDRAGFIRQMTTVKDPETLVAVLGRMTDPTPKFEVGHVAPDFAMRDMNGELVHLSDWRGHKNLLLTFFPKCFGSG